MKKFAVIENNKVVNVIVGVEDEVVAANPEKYIDVTNGWDFNSPINPEPYFPIPKRTCSCLGEEHTCLAGLTEAAEQQTN